MASKPKTCKYGCGTIITWNESQRFFQGPDMQKHDCRDWPGVGSGGGQTVTGKTIESPPNYTGNTYGNSAPQTETLIGVQAKKTWENYFKHLEAINPNLVSIHSAIEENNNLLTEIIKHIQSLENQLAVCSIRGAAETKREEEDVI